MTFIEPLALQTWIVQVFSGTPIIFFGIALLAIATISSYFKMNAINMFLMIGVFVLMFTEYIGQAIFALFAIIGGLIVGYVLTKVLE